LSLTPAPVYTHLHRLTGPAGLFEHADHDVPRREHGCCVDDAARALVVVARDPDPDPAVTALGELCLDVCLSAQTPDGRTHNRRDAGGRWVDQPGLGDWWGRSVWGLGYVVAHGAPDQRRRALDGLLTALRQRSPDRRGLAFAAFGVSEVLAPSWPTAPGAQPQLRPVDQAALVALLDDAAACLAVPAAPATPQGWPWPEARLTYANAAIPEALVATGTVLQRDDLVRRGLDLLGWLLAIETLDGHLSVTPVGGRGPGETGPAYDQQPIEVAAIADACARAFDVTGDDRWLEGVALARRWFEGDNDRGVALVDLRTGAGFDGLTPHGRNLNRGAESTLAAISTIRQATRLTLTV
jgi:hypothetical protein